MKLKAKQCTYNMNKFNLYICSLLCLLILSIIWYQYYTGSDVFITRVDLVAFLNFTSLLGNELLCNCSNNNNFSFIIVICSAVQNLKQRNAIRNSWAKDIDVNSKLIFFLGNVSESEHQLKIMKENNTFGDIVQGNFIDSYHNLTLKSLLMLKWVYEYCPCVKYIVKCDDDIFLNIPNLQIMLNQSSEDVLMGFLICDGKPFRNPESKWYAPYSAYRQSNYPNYLSGTTYVIPRKIIPPLFSAIPFTPFFHMEDVFITGMLTERKKLKLKDHPGFSYEKRKLDACVFKNLIVAHEVKTSQFLSIWGKLRNNSECLPNISFNRTLRSC